MAKEKRDRQGEKQTESKPPAVAHHSAKETPRLKSRFDQQLRFGPGNQDVGCHAELVTPEDLRPEQVLQRPAPRAFSHERFEVSACLAGNRRAR